MSFIYLVSEYLQENRLPENFEEYPPEKLSATLRTFYGSLRNKQGDVYSKSAYINIRAAINRYLTSPPYNKTINIMHDRQFMAANHVFMGILRHLRESGKDVTHHKSAITPGDMQKLYDSGLVSNDSPSNLQRKVFLEVCLQFGRRGREGLREMKKSSIIIQKDDQNKEFATFAYNELEKNHQVHMPKEHEKKQIMYSQEDESTCPIFSLKKYLSKLNPKCEAFFQKPRNLANPETEQIWYQNKPLGIHTLESFMKNISKEANLSKSYTNHCLRAAATTILANAGIETRDICSVTGHRNAQSLESYIKEPSMEKRKEMCNILHNYGKSEEKIAEENNSLLPKTLPTSTITSSEMQKLNPNINTSASSSGLFYGAQFTGATTINVMINQNKAN